MTSMQQDIEAVSLPQSVSPVAFDRFMLPAYLQLNDAIERFTADMVAHDPHAFTVGNADLRYVIERHLFFALFSDRKLYHSFVRAETDGQLPDENSLSIWERRIAPYYLRGWPATPIQVRPRFALGRKLADSRFMRHLHRFYGRADIEMGDMSG